MKKINPEINRLARAAFYTMAFFGYVHFLSSLISAVHRRRLSDMNPYHLINIDRFLGNAWSKPLAFIIGWLIFLALLITIYRLLKPSVDR